MDGYTSTKNIRAFERSQSPSAVSQDGSLSLKKWVPIIAVSASLLDGEREFYKDIGFDGWILKPILFNRLQHIMLGTTDPVRRKEDLYKPGVWERGGWFEEAEMTARRHEEGETK